MIEINKNVILVKGVNRGAIYQLDTGNVYSINAEAVQIIEKYINQKVSHDFLVALHDEGLFSFNYTFCNYIPSNVTKKLNTVWYEVTQSCNMKCLHCYEGGEHKPGKDLLTLHDWKNITHQLKEIGIGRVIVIGGEPTLYKHIEELLVFLHREEIKTTLFTNTYPINNELMNTILKTRPEIKVSLYGINANVHDAITGIQGSFDKLINTITFLGKNGIEVNIAITVMRENEHQIDSFPEFVAQLPIQRYKIDVIRKVFDGKQNLHFPDSESVKRKSYRHSPNFYATKEIFDRNISFNSCWFGKLVITENGKVLPCVFARNHEIGNIRTDTIKELLYKSTELDNYWRLAVCKLNKCKLCEYRYACIDCRPLAEGVSNIHEKNPRCLYNPYKGVWGNV